MIQKTTRRGRPIGSVKKGDDRLLYRVAELVETERLAPTTAIRRVLDAKDTGGVRRLQRKYKLDGNRYRDKVRMHLAERSARQESQANGQPYLPSNIIAATRSVSNLTAIYKSLNMNGTWEALRRIHEITRPIREIQNMTASITKMQKIWEIPSALRGIGSFKNVP